MEFEDMKKIWDSQNNEQVYAINEQALHQRVIKKNIAAKKNANMFEIGMVIICIFLDIFYLSETVIFLVRTGFDHFTINLAQVLILLVVTVYIFKDRKERLKKAGQSSGSILDDLNQALRTMDYEIRRQKNMIWWYFMPIVVVMLLNLFITSGTYSLAVILVLVVSVSLALTVQRFSMRPLSFKKGNLLSLKKLLMDSEN